ncbi:MAG: hypothetical protein EOM70_04580 [Clostridia bacterium]|nr:hypothetical protein [Clostridia bacterium]
MQPILLIDRDPYYASRLAERLSHLLERPILAKPAHHPRLALEIEALAEHGVVVVADPALMTMLRQEGLDGLSILWVPWQAFMPGHTRDPVTLYRLMPASQMASILKEQLSARETGQKAYPSPETDHSVLSQLTVALDLGWEGHFAFVQNWLDQQLLAGHEVFYLPLMPNYRMKLVQAPGNGPNLTQLLLRLANGDALSPGELGTYLERHDKGYWQFRPAERSDDLVLADATWLKSIVVLVRGKIRQLAGNDATGPVTSVPKVFVDCQGLSFSRVAQIAVLSDQLAVYLGPELDWASQCAQRELGELIARLPANCQILEMKVTGNIDPVRFRQPFT